MEFERSDVQAYSTAVLYDAGRRLGLEIGLRGVLPLTAERRFAAPAFTVRFAPVREVRERAANLYDVIVSAPTQSVLVLQVGLERWICGANITRFAELSGLSGMVFDGCIRDLAEVRQRRFPVFARGISVAGYAGELAISAVGEAIICGGAPVCPGDIVVGDEDGAVCIPLARTADILFQAEEIAGLDVKLGADIEAGRPLDELHATRSRWSVQRVAT